MLGFRTDGQTLVTILRRTAKLRSPSIRSLLGSHRTCSWSHDRDAASIHAPHQVRWIRSSDAPLAHRLQRTCPATQSGLRCAVISGGQRRRRPRSPSSGSAGRSCRKPGANNPPSLIPVANRVRSMGEGVPAGRADDFSWPRAATNIEPNAPSAAAIIVDRRSVRSKSVMAAGLQSRSQAHIEELPRMSQVTTVTLAARR
jgi:hypothetical protein